MSASINDEALGQVTDSYDFDMEEMEEIFEAYDEALEACGYDSDVDDEDDIEECIFEYFEEKFGDGDMLAPQGGMLAQT